MANSILRTLPGLAGRFYLTETLLTIVMPPHNKGEQLKRKSLIKAFMKSPGSFADRFGNEVTDKVFRIGKILKEARAVSNKIPTFPLWEIIAVLSREINEIAAAQASAVAGAQLPNVIGKAIEIHFNGQLEQRHVRRLGKIVTDFAEAHASIGPDIANGVTVFGSARTQPNDPAYKAAYDIGELLAVNGFSVITGGGKGIMEAANRGAFEIGGTSVGLRVKLPHEQVSNVFVNKCANFQYFFSRKMMLTALSQAYVLMPGGLGTIDEGSEILTLIQTDKMEVKPVILYDSFYWKGFVDWLKNTVLVRGNISPDDLELFQMVDTPEDTVRIIQLKLAESRAA